MAGSRNTIPALAHSKHFKESAIIHFVNFFSKGIRFIFFNQKIFSILAFTPSPLQLFHCYTDDYRVYVAYICFHRHSPFAYFGAFYLGQIAEKPVFMGVLNRNNNIQTVVLTGTDSRSV